MKRSDLLILLNVLQVRVMDNPSLKSLYNELLDAYNKTKSRPDYRLPIYPEISYLEVLRNEMD